MSQRSPSHIRATAIWALATATLRRLALSVLFTIATNSYQTTCTVSERTFNKRQTCQCNMQSRVITLYALRHGGSSDTALKEEYCVDISQCQLLEEKAGEGKAAKAARLLFGPPAAPMQGKGLGLDQPGSAWFMRQELCSSPTGKVARTTASKGLSQRVQQSQVALTDNHTETRNASLGERGHCHYRSVSFKLASLGSNCSFQGKQLLLARGSLAGKFKCMVVI